MRLRKYTKPVFCILMLIALTYSLHLARAYYRFNNPQYSSNIACVTPSLWAHRGWSIAFPENSTEAVMAAESIKFCGVEVDINWVDEKMIYVVHDLPQDYRNKSLTTLFSLLEHVKSTNISLWLDFKNINATNAEEAAKHIKKLLSDLKIDQARIVIEIQDPGVIAVLREVLSNITISYWVHWPVKTERSFLGMMKLKYEIGYYGVSTVSLDYKNIDDEFIENFSHLRMLTWTVNDEKTLKHLLNAGADIILTDTLTPGAMKSFRN
jgi:glycerophosphoryl diester phosphodiesterase